MKKFLCLLVVAAALSSPASAAPPKNVEGIAVVVNQDAISASDVRERLRLILASTGLPPTPEFQEKLKSQILNMLIEEQLKKQEAARLKLTVSPEEIKQGLDQIAGQNNMTGDQFGQMLGARGIKLKTLQDQIASQLLWAKVVGKTIRPRIDVTDKDIDAELARLKDGVGQTQYLVSEILLVPGDAKKESEVAAVANRLVAQLRQQPEAFPSVAQQFSQAAGAPQGGSLGWVTQGQLPEDIEKVVQTLQKGQISDPVKTLAGYHILLVRDTRTISAELLPKREEILDRLGTDRLDRDQRRLLFDLRSSAFIETRV